MPCSNPTDPLMTDAPEPDTALPDTLDPPHPFPTPHTALRLVPLSMLRKTLKHREIAALAGVHMSAIGLMERNKARHIYGLFCADGLKLYQVKMVKFEPCDIPRELPITISF